MSLTGLRLAHRPSQFKPHKLQPHANACRCQPAVAAACSSRPAFYVFPGGCPVHGRIDGMYNDTRHHLTLTTPRQGKERRGRGYMPGLGAPDHVGPQPPVRVRVRGVHPGPGVVPDPQVR
jgi:hypothetical protein